MSEHDKDILISRLLDGGADEAVTGSTWDAFRAMAERDPTLWRELAEAQRQQADLAAAVEAAVTVADSVEAPVLDHITYRFSERMRLMGSWGGWAAAAAIVLVWATGFRVGGAGGVNNQAGIPGAVSNPTCGSSYLNRASGCGTRRVADGCSSTPGRRRTDGATRCSSCQIMEKRVVGDMASSGSTRRPAGAGAVDVPSSEWTVLASEHETASRVLFMRDESCVGVVAAAGVLMSAGGGGPRAP
jgi:hypothetical protein